MWCSTAAHRFDARSRTATAAGQPLALTRKETGILEYLLLHRGRPVSQEELFRCPPGHVWDNFSNSIRVRTFRSARKAAGGAGL